MPLESGAKPGSPGFGRNIAAEIKAGKPAKQAEAIAYSKARGDAVPTFRADMSADDWKGLERLFDKWIGEEKNEKEHKDALQPSPYAGPPEMRAEKMTAEARADALLARCK